MKRIYAGKKSGFIYVSIFCLILSGSQALAQRGGRGEHDGGRGGREGGENRSMGRGAGGGNFDRAAGVPRQQNYNRPGSAERLPGNNFRGGYGNARPVAYNRGGGPGSNNFGRPVQVRGYNNRPAVNVNIGIGRGGFGRGFGYSHRFYYGGGYHYRPSYYRPFYAPNFGIRLNILPFGYSPFFIGANQYYYSEGAYYRRYNDYYESVQPPLGAKAPVLPRSAQAVLIDGQTYYEDRGTYYQRTYNERGENLYEVVGTNGVLETDRPIQQQIEGELRNGTAIGNLPDGTQMVTQDGKSYFVTPSGEYFEQFVDENGKIYYVKTPSQSQRY